MSTTRSSRVRSALVAIGMLGTLLVGAQTATADGVSVFTGGGRSLTPEGAVQAAIEDAINSAASEMLYTCEVVGEPQLFPGTHPVLGDIWRAMADVACTP